MDQLAAVVEGHDADPLRQGAIALEVRHPVLDVLHHLERIGPPQHQDDSRHDLAFPVQHGRAMAHRMADGDLGHIPDEHRRPTLLLDDNVLQVLDRLDHPDTADNVSVGGTVENPASGIRIIASDRLVHLRNGQVVLPQLDGIDDHVILLHIAAQRVDIDHTGQPF